MADHAARKERACALPACWPLRSYRAFSGVFMLPARRSPFALPPLWASIRTPTEKGEGPLSIARLE